MILLRVPWLPSSRRGFKTWAITISPFVFILREQADNPAIIAHEQTHLDQIAATGWLRWYWKYIFDTDFRRQQEAEGYAAQRAVERHMSI